LDYEEEDEEALGEDSDYGQWLDEVDRGIQSHRERDLWD